MISKPLRFQFAFLTRTLKKFVDVLTCIAGRPLRLKPTGSLSYLRLPFTRGPTVPSFLPSLAPQSLYALCVLASSCTNSFNGDGHAGTNTVSTTSSAFCMPPPSDNFYSRSAKRGGSQILNCWYCAKDQLVPNALSHSWKCHNCDSTNLGFNQVCTQPSLCHSSLLILFSYVFCRKEIMKQSHLRCMTKLWTLINACPEVARIGAPSICRQHQLIHCLQCGCAWAHFSILFNLCFIVLTFYHRDR